jgi:hypothetical protein
VSPRRFDGWEPREVQEFYDADGERCAMSDAWLTVTTRESEWDESSRGRAMRLGEYEAGFCQCGCNQPLAVSRNKDQVFVVDDFTCYAARALEQVREQQRAEAEAKQLPPRHGNHLYVRPHDPDRDKPLNPPTRKPPRGGTSANQVRSGSTQG